MPAKKSAEKIPFLVSQVLGPRRALCVAGWGMRAQRSGPSNVKPAPKAPEKQRA
jgi:hypothetical protein